MQPAVQVHERLAFTRELVNGRIRGFEANKIVGGINFSHDLKPEEFKVTDAMFKAFRDGARPITTADLVEETDRVVPLMATAKERMEELRNWAKVRAVPATIQPDESRTYDTGGRRLDMAS